MDQILSLERISKKITKSDIDFSAFNIVHNKFAWKEMPLLYKSISRMKNEQPYRNLKIIHNCHLTLSTICKLEPLLYSGAQVTVTVTKDLNYHKDVIKLLKAANVNYIRPEAIEDDYDISMDCCGSLADIVSPRIGAIELTQTGSIKYKQGEFNYPVICVDKSKIKHIETLLGTGNGFLRAFIELTKENISGKKFVVFGYGKVGHGIVKALSTYTSDIIVIEKSQSAIEEANIQRIKVINIDEYKTVKEVIKQAFCVVTATGRKGTISEYFNKEDFNCYLANMGSEDEFGERFSNQDVLFNKKPINFALEVPTLIKYLDPVFYAHNLAIDILLSKKIGKSFSYLPTLIDELILNEWANYHNYDITDINFKY